MTPLRTKRLILRNWCDADRALFHRINSDERVMEFFPYRRDRAEADAFMDELRETIQSRGFGLTAIEVAVTGECAGYAGLAQPVMEPFRTIAEVEIGWRLAPECWGRGYVTEAAEAWLGYGFDTLLLDEIVAFAVWNNDRSTAVMRRLGMHRDPSGDFDVPEFAETHPHLARFVVHRIRREEWAAKRAAC